MNWRICAKKHGMLKVCPLEISRFDVPTLDHLEQELKIEELRAPIKVDTEQGAHSRGTSHSRHRDGRRSPGRVVER